MRFKIFQLIISLYVHKVNPLQSITPKPMHLLLICGEGDISLFLKSVAKSCDLNSLWFLIT